MSEPSRGEIWRVDLDPTRGHEQSGMRPALILSDDRFNHGKAGLVIIIPITGRDKKIPSHVRIEPPEGGVTMTSFAKCEDIRSVSKDRLSGHRLGYVGPGTMDEVERRVRYLLSL